MNACHSKLFNIYFDDCTLGRHEELICLAEQARHYIGCIAHVEHQGLTIKGAIESIEVTPSRGPLPDSLLVRIRVVQGHSLLRYGALFTFRIDAKDIRHNPRRVFIRAPHALTLPAARAAQ